MKLSEAKKNDTIKVTNVNLDDKFCLRLREMGIHEGSEMTVSQKSAFGSRILAKGNERIAIDSKCAKCIEIELVNNAQDAKNIQESVK
jgi:ferrous iron transport protein A